jgi:hypothetical protein
MKLTLLFSAVTLITTQYANAGLFSTYADHAQTFRSVVIAPVPDSVYKSMQEQETSKDASLFFLEQGRLQQSHQDYAASKKSFESAFALIDEKNQKATISASGTGSKVLSFISNDSVIPYSIPSYEQVLAHVYQAINCIALKDVEGASVEMRVAQRIQREIELAHSNETEKAVAKAKKGDTASSEQESSAVNNAFSGLDTIAGKVKNSYQNAYSFYMAATLWEAIGENNDALVDFKKAYELQPDINIAQDVKRLDADTPIHPKNQKYPVVVLFEQGLIPQKVPATLAIPTLNGLVNVSYANYDPASYLSPRQLTITADGAVLGTTSPLSDIGALAVKTFKEKSVSTLATQITRSTVKYVAQQQIGNHFGVFGQLAANAYNVASEKPDLRAWTTLPSNTQVARLMLSEGSHSIELNDGGTRSSLNIDVKPGQTIFIHSIEANQQMTANSFTVSKNKTLN